MPARTVHAQSADDGGANGYELQCLHGHDDGHDDEDGMFFQFFDNGPVLSMESKSLLLLNYCSINLVEVCVFDGT